MNWVEGSKEWGTIQCPPNISACKESFFEKDTIREVYTFTNITNQCIQTKLTDISIYTTFNDNYEAASVCLNQRCHTHIFCGDMISYVAALRMNGNPPHMGLVLTRGSLGGYSVERILSDKRASGNNSNDRGDFLMHPSPVLLDPGESFTVEWILFWHGGKEDFFHQLKRFSKYIHVECNHFVAFQNEKVVLKLQPCFQFMPCEVSVSRDGKSVPFSVLKNGIHIEEKAVSLGEYRYEIEVQGIKTFCSVLIKPNLKELAQKRCRFICDHQQCMKSNSHLSGAYLAFDNQTGAMIYDSQWFDWNAGRERLGMGVLMARYLQHNSDQDMEKSLSQYVEFVYRELYCRSTGEVYNDVGNLNPFERLYNYPWMATFFLELYFWNQNMQHLMDAYQVMRKYYEKGGEQFYALDIPAVMLTKALEAKGRNEEANNIRQCFVQHADYIKNVHYAYPSHEVSYEQSIVAAGVNLLLQVYELTGNAKYLEEAKSQFCVLDTFNFIQPDYHLYENSIRHWDGYWFGKYQLLGDTYPHYWSALSGNAMFDLFRFTGDKQFFKRSEHSIRGVLSLFGDGGRASCAMIFPCTVNGKNAKCYDPYANDQDWGLYFALRFYEKVNCELI